MVAFVGVNQQRVSLVCPFQCDRVKRRPCNAKDVVMRRRAKDARNGARTRAEENRVLETCKFHHETCSLEKEKTNSRACAKTKNTVLSCLGCVRELAFPRFTRDTEREMI